jgi:hypothetical protein
LAEAVRLCREARRLKPEEYMDRETKIFLGRILGEIYSLRRRVVEDQRASTETIYGLFHGIESTIDQEIKRTGFISRQVEH